MNTKLRNEELPRLTPSEYEGTDKLPIVVVLDNVRSMNNVGSVFRTSDAFLIESVRLCGITPTPPHREIQKTALGATENVSWSHHESTVECIKALKEAGYHIVSVEQAERTTTLADFNPKGPVAIVFGNEVDGVVQEVVDLSDEVVEIPQQGTKHSLNISVCAGIVLWHTAKQMA